MLLTTEGNRPRYFRVVAKRSNLLPRWKADCRHELCGCGSAKVDNGRVIAEVAAAKSGSGRAFCGICARCRRALSDAVAQFALRLNRRVPNEWKACPGSL